MTDPAAVSMLGGLHLQEADLTRHAITAKRTTRIIQVALFHVTTTTPGDEIAAMTKKKKKKAAEQNPKC